MVVFVCVYVEKFAHFLLYLVFFSFLFFFVFLHFSSFFFIFLQTLQLYNAKFYNKTFTPAIKEKLAGKDIHTDFEAPIDKRYVSEADFRKLVLERLDSVCQDPMRIHNPSSCVLGVFYCGNNSIGDALAKAVISAQIDHLAPGRCKSMKCYISYHKEDF